MPRIIDYPTVLNRLQRAGFTSLYHNSGAFGFAATTPTISRGWIGTDDPSIREQARHLIRHIPLPHESTLSQRLIAAWQQGLPGMVWLMPKSHWAYELEFGNAAWLPDALEQIGVDSRELKPLNNGAAIEFTPADDYLLQALVLKLLTHLQGSDFQVVFREHQTLCTIHHRQQLWWTTTQKPVIEMLDGLVIS